MSIFNYNYGDEILLHFCHMDIDLCNILKCLNKYYYAIVNNNDNYKFLISLLDYSKKSCKTWTGFKDNLFICAYKKGNMLVCNYLINKFDNINIHSNNEYAFQLSCKNNHFKIAKWLVDIASEGSQENFTPINIHADNELAFKLSCEYDHLEIAKWLIELGVEVNMCTKWIDYKAIKWLRTNNLIK